MVVQKMFHQQYWNLRLSIWGHPYCFTIHPVSHYKKNSWVVPPKLRTKNKSHDIIHHKSRSFVTTKWRHKRMFCVWLLRAYFLSFFKNGATMLMTHVTSTKLENFKMTASQSQELFQKQPLDIQLFSSWCSGKIPEMEMDKNCFEEWTKVLVSPTNTTQAGRLNFNQLRSGWVISYKTSTGSIQTLESLEWKYRLYILYLSWNMLDRIRYQLMVIRHWKKIDRGCNQHPLLPPFSRPSGFTLRHGDDGKSEEIIPSFAFNPTQIHVWHMHLHWIGWFLLYM